MVLETNEKVKKKIKQTHLLIIIKIEEEINQ